MNITELIASIGEDQIGSMAFTKDRITVKKPDGSTDEYQFTTLGIKIVVNQPDGTMIEGVDESKREVAFVRTYEAIKPVFAEGKNNK